jgi:hypothetical protein
VSRSRRRTPICGITFAPSEKLDKQFASRCERRTNQQILRASSDDTALVSKRMVSNVWCMAKDGKLHFDARSYPELLRK